MLKNLPAMKETWVQFLGREDPLEYLVYIFKWECMAYSSYCDTNNIFQVLSLGQEDTLEKEMASHSSILAWEIPLTEGSDGLQSEGLQKCWTQLCD